MELIHIANATFSIELLSSPRQSHGESSNEAFA